MSASLLLSPIQELSAGIGQAETLFFLEQQLETLDERDLVVFDMDDVLIVPQDAILHLKVEKKRYEIAARYTAHLPDHQQIHFFSLVWKNAETVLVEPHIATLIRQMQEKGIRVIVLTAARVGRVGIIKDTVAFRIHELQSKGIDLRHAFPEVETLTLNELNHGKGSPVFQSGVMLSHRFPKGEVLATFLKKLNWKPRRLIFIDDLRDNVESVENELSKVGIEELQCWHYLASNRHVKEVDHAVADLQMRTLIEKGVWLSDKEAKRILFAERIPEINISH